MTTHNFNTPFATAHAVTPAERALAPNDYAHASIAERSRTDWRDEPVLALVPAKRTTRRKSTGYADRTRRFFALDANDAVARTLEAR